MGYNPSSFPGGNDDPTLPKDSTFPHGSGHTDYGSGYPTQYAGSPRPSSLYPPPPPNNRPSRRGIVTIGFIIVLVLIIGVLAGKVLFTPGLPPTHIQSENLGVFSYYHTDGPYPQPPAANGAIVAHGDILNDGSCHIKIFYSGDTVANLGHGSFRLVRLTGGNRDAILQYVKDTIQSQLGNCPLI